MKRYELLQRLFLVCLVISLAACGNEANSTLEAADEEVTATITAEFDNQ